MRIQGWLALLAQIALASSALGVNADYVVKEDVVVPRGWVRRAPAHGSERVHSIDVDNVMTKDLALSIHGKAMTREHYVNTFEFIDHVKKVLVDKLHAAGLA